LGLTDDATLGGYLELHQRPPAFQGSDGQAYSAAIYVDDTPRPDGRFSAALLFVRWGSAGDHPVGHVETEDLALAPTRGEAEAAVRALSLWAVKQHLEAALERRRATPEW
jgi:hypothetical protein